MMMNKEEGGGAWEREDGERRTERQKNKGEKIVVRVMVVGRKDFSRETLPAENMADIL